MKQHDHKRFYDLISGWLRMRGQPAEPQSLGLWLVALQHLTIAEIEQAVKAAMQDTEHGMKLPSPALVLRHVVRRPEYHVKPPLPDIARGSGMSGILDHLESKQERDSRGHRWIAQMRADLARRAER